MYQFWQVLCLMLFVVVAMLLYEKGIRPEATTVVPDAETIESMIMKEVL